MKKKRTIFLSILVIGLIILTLVEEHNWFSKKDPVSFQNVGSFINGNNRAYVFYVSDTSWREIEKHGLSLDHEKGNITASFYYLKESNAPDLSLAKNYMDAIDKGQTYDCVASFWINGDPLLIKFPSKSWPTRVQK